MLKNPKGQNLEPTIIFDDLSSISMAAEEDSLLKRRKKLTY